MSVAIEIEPFTLDLAAEIKPLGQRCWNESTIIKGMTCAFYGERDFAIEPDVEQYKTLSDMKSLLVLTLRDNSQMFGYGIGIMYKSLHHRGTIVGGVDSFYIDPQYRSYASLMIEKFEQSMISSGAVIIGWPTHIDGPLYKILKEKGYVGDDIVMEKKTCAS